MDLAKKLRDFLSQPRVGQIRLPAPSAQSAAFGPAGQIVNRIAQIPQVKQQINRVPNIQLRANAPTLGQAFKNVTRPQAQLPYQLTNRPLTGNKFMDVTNKYVVNPAGQAGSAAVGGLTAGLANLPTVAPTNFVQRRAKNVGQVAGLSGFLLGPGGAGLGKIGLAGEAGVRGILPQATPRLLARVAPAIGGEAAQTGVFAGAKSALGQDFNPVTDLAAGLGIRALPGVGKAVLGKLTKSQLPPDLIKQAKALGLKGINPKINDLHPDDLEEYANIAMKMDKKIPLNDREFKSVERFLETFAPGVDRFKIKDKRVRDLLAYAIDINMHTPAAERQKFPGLGLVGDNKGGFKPGSGMGKPKIEEKYAFNINKQRLQVNPEQKAQLDEVVNQIKPQLEEVKGKKLSFDEVRADSQKADLLQKVVGRESTAKFEGSLLATRERLVTLNNEIDRLTKTGDTVNAARLTKELIDQVRVVSSQAADIGRKLGSFRITAQERPFREQLLEEIIKKKGLTDAEIDKLTKAAAKVDFNNPQQVQKLYRDFIQPSIGSMLEEYRYFNLLSSPLTHVVNTFSNALQAGAVKPTTKLISGIIDPVAAVLGSKQRENYVGEVPMYYRGMFASIPEAFKKVKDIYAGRQMLTNLDFKTLERTPAKFNIVTKTLEASDQFFRTLIEGAEREAFGYKFAKQGTNVAADDISNLAKQSAEYSTYRQGLKPEGQGAVLNWVDKGTEAVLGLRKVPGVSWFIPFVQTPMNIFKQGVEYSPMGLATTIGAANKREQVAKAMLGSTVFAGAGLLAMQDKLTWAAPKDPEQKKNFYAAGMQPYSAKIGNKWVSYSKLGPISYPLALAAGIKYSFKDDPNAAANDTFDKLSNSLAGIMGFFGDQSYVQGIGNIVNALGGEEGYNLNRIIASVPAQYIPAASFQRWVNSIIDPVYRKPDNIVDSLKSNVVGMTGGLDFYENPFGEPSRRQYPLGNALNPLRTTKENPDFKELYDIRQEKLQSNAIIRREKKLIEEGKVGLNPASAAEKTTDKKKLIEQARLETQEKIARDKVKLQGSMQKVGTKLFYNDNGSVKSVELNRDIAEPNLGKNKELNEERVAKWKSALNSKEKDITTLYELGKITEVEAEKQLTEIEKIKTIFKNEQAKKEIYEPIPLPQLSGFNEIDKKLKSQYQGDITTRTNKVVKLFQEGVINQSEAEKLLLLLQQARSTGGGGGRRKKIRVTPPAFKSVPSVKIQLRKPKLAKIKLEGSRKKKKKVKGVVDYGKKEG